MISTQTFITAVVLLLSFTWGVLQVKEPGSGVDKATQAQWTRIQAMNTCLLHGADLLEMRYAEYRALVAAQEPKQFTQWFRGFGMGSGQLIPRDNTPLSPCRRQYDLQEAPGVLLSSANDYVNAYDAARPEAEALELWLKDGYRPERLADITESFDRRIEQARALSIPFRQALEQPHLDVRQQQLKAIESRLGHDQHWYTLRFMVIARQTIDALDAMGDGGPLTATQLTAMRQSSATAWSEAEDSLRPLPRLRSANDKQPVWKIISQVGKDWLEGVELLDRHWSEGADAERLNQDLAEVRAAYDKLLAGYNAAAGPQY
jgi:hypothetical protein